MVSTTQKNNALLFGGTGVPFGTAASNKLRRLNVKTNGSVQIKTQILLRKNSQNSIDIPPPMYGQAMYYTQEYSNGDLRVSFINYLIILNLLGCRLFNWRYNRLFLQY